MGGPRGERRTRYDLAPTAIAWRRSAASGKKVRSVALPVWSVPPHGSSNSSTGTVGLAARSRPPWGWIVVCFDASDEVTVRVLDEDDQPLLETTRSPAAS